MIETDIDMVVRRLRIAHDMGIMVQGKGKKPVRRSTFALLHKAGGWSKNTLYQWYHGRYQPRIPSAEKLDRMLMSWGF